ncbi:MAG: hypothetical protein RJA99_39 [Pseudomonadota bacterium]|jgi:hypothetical protein
MFTCIVGALALCAANELVGSTPYNPPMGNGSPVLLAAAGTPKASGAGAPGTPAAASRINSVETIVSDMTLENDSRLDGIPNFLWATGPKPAAVLMGADPRGSKMQQWWLDMPAVDARFKTADLWKAYVQWFIVFEGVGNGANNVRVEIRNPRTYYLSRSTGQWRPVGTAQAGSHWFQAWKKDLTWANDKVDLRSNPDGSVAVKVPRGSPNVMHGIWQPGKIDIAGIVPDMEALFATVQARLVVDDPAQPDDRDRANLLIHVGGDYYPDMKATAANSFPPSAGLSRLKRVTSAWQSFNFATIDSARQDYRGAPASIPTARFRANPPPLD